MITKHLTFIFITTVSESKLYGVNKKNNNISKSPKIGEGGDEEHIIFLYLPLLFFIIHFFCFCFCFVFCFLFCFVLFLFVCLCFFCTLVGVEGKCFGLSFFFLSFLFFSFLSFLFFFFPFFYFLLNNLLLREGIHIPVIV